jgi:hypothetical protein
MASDVVETGEAEAAENLERMVVHESHTFTERAPGLVGMRQRALEVIHDRQPHPDHLSAFGVGLVGESPFVPLALVVGVGERAQESRV